MKIREYLEKMSTRNNATFIIQKAVKDEHSPFYNDEYKTTPVRHRDEWLQGEGFIDNYIVIKADHPPIDVTGAWNNWYKGGLLRCAMVTTETDLLTHYGENQGRSMIAYYDREVRKQMETKR